VRALRPYQVDLVQRAALALRDHRVVVLQVGTGGGKTHCAAEIILRRLAKVPASRVLFLAGLDAILDDTVRRLRAAGLHVGLLQADRPADPTAPVQVASWQTITARGARPPADFIVLDECHHAAAETVRTILEAYPSAYILGLTATPERGDGAALGAAGFRGLVSGPSNAELCADGWLVPLDLVGPPGPADGLACDPLEAWRRWADGRRTVAFCASIAAAEDLCARALEAGVPAGLLHGGTPRRDRALARELLTTGDVRLICTVDVLREGWDCPAAEVALFARSVGTIGGWLQMLGRISRPSPDTGKHRALAIDLAGSWMALGLRDDPRVWSLEGAAVVAGAKLPPLARCRACLAVFAPAARCPRCDAPLSAAAGSVERIPRVLRNADKLALVSHLPLAERDGRYVAKLVRVGVERRRMSTERAAAWAEAEFERRFKRKPGAAA